MAVVDIAKVLALLEGSTSGSARLLASEVWAALVVRPIGAGVDPAPTRPQPSARGRLGRPGCEDAWLTRVRRGHVRRA